MSDSQAFPQGPSDGELIPLTLSRILIRETEDTHFLELREVTDEPEEPLLEAGGEVGPEGGTPAEDGASGPPLPLGPARRSFPIVIAYPEAAAIERRLMGQRPLRPQTHDLLANLIDELGYRLSSVVITDLRDHTFYAELRLINDATQHRVELDARPSDAIALAAGLGDTPLFAAPRVFEAIGYAEP